MDHSTPIIVWVPGRPVPGGSKTATLIRRKGGEIVMTKSGRPLITVRDAAKGNAEWKATVAFYARRAYTGEPLAGALAVRFDFIVTRPKGHFGTKGVRASAPRWPIVKPDGLKLTRAAEDACTNLIWRDDALIVEHQITKRYGDNPGVKITVVELETAPAKVEQAPLFQETR